MPRYKFKWTNLPPAVLRALRQDLTIGYDDVANPADALREAYGARPDEEFIRGAWPTLVKSWLPTATEARERIARALQEAHHDKAFLKGSGAQLAYLKDLRNAKRLREIVWEELVAAGEVERTSEQDRDEEAGDDEAGIERSQYHVERPAKTAKTHASRKTSTVTSSDGPRKGAKTRDGQRPRQNKQEVEKSLEATLARYRSWDHSELPAGMTKHMCEDPA